MTDPDRTQLICWTVAEKPEPGSPSVMVKCIVCATPVWRSDSSFGVDADPVCFDCVSREVEMDAMEVLAMPEPIRGSMLAEGWTLEETEAVDRFAATFVQHEIRRRRGQQ